MIEAPTSKKLIEVALPLEAINAASAREKSIRHGHPSTLHLWWARRPLAAARAVIFAQMVDDPSAHPDIFPTPEKQEKERQRLFRIIEELVRWENTTNEAVLQAARDEIWQSWRAACAQNAGHPRAKELFNRHVLPAFHDPFAGGGALPLEAQRLGLVAYASDLNPVAVLICKAMIEIPPKFAGKPPVNPEARKDPRMFAKERSGAAGLAEDVRYYGKWMRDEAERRVGHLYPRVEITPEMAEERPDLKPLIGQKLTVIAWLWARTVKSPNPAFRDVDVPLITNFMLSTVPGKEAYVEPLIAGKQYRFAVRTGRPRDLEAAQAGTRLGRGANFRCLLSDVPIPEDHVRREFQAKRSGEAIIAVVAEGVNGRVYLPATREQEAIARSSRPSWYPQQEMTEENANLLSGRGYGITHWHEIFTPRQLIALSICSDLVQCVRERVLVDTVACGLDDGPGIEGEGGGATAYADTLALFAAFAVDKAADYWSTACSWHASKELIRNTFGRQAIPMVWDYAEANPFSLSAGNVSSGFEWAERAILKFPASGFGICTQADARVQGVSMGKVVSTDPPYYDNIDYADLSDFFYVWLRHSLKSVFPNLLATLETPKADELVAASYRHGGKKPAELFFLRGMTDAMMRLAADPHPAFPITIYYAYRQSESRTKGTTSTGWETFLEALIEAGFVLSGTWPIRTEMANRMVGAETNSLASSIVMVCRPRPNNSGTITRREFITRLRAEMPMALAHLQRGNIAPVDLEQAAIGPGMAIYTSYERVVDAEGNALSVRDALRLINQTLYEVLTEQEGDYDSDTRWALVWFEQHGFAEGDYGTGEQLSKSKNTSVEGMVGTGILVSKGGKVRLLKPDELTADWAPEKDRRLTVWEMTHQLIRALQGGEAVAANLAARLGSKSEVARDLAYRLYTVCERRKRPAEATLYNGLVKSWPEIVRLAQEEASGRPQQGQMI